MTYAYQLGCEACEIEKEDRLVKQKPRHTCGKDGVNKEILADQLKTEYNPAAALNNFINEKPEPYKAEVRRISDDVAKICSEYKITGIGHVVFERIARATVAEKDKSFEQGYLTAINHIKSGQLPDNYSARIKHGLIPNPEKGNNG